jgi:hypothetical protein
MAGRLATSGADDVELILISGERVCDIVLTGRVKGPGRLPVDGAAPGRFRSFESPTRYERNGLRVEDRRDSFKVAGI